MKRIAAWLASAVVAVSVVGNAQAQSCAGDCDGDETVAIDELVACVGISLGSMPLTECTDCDPDGDASVAINELIAVVSSSLGSCGAASGTPSEVPRTPTATPPSGEVTQCCVPAYYVWNCESRTGAECVTLGGVDQGTGVCSPNPCADLPPSNGHGICCLPNAAGDEIECEDRASVACVDAGGVVKTGGTVCLPETCADVPPPNPDVRCCLPNPAGDEIECEDRTASQCSDEGGVDKGEGTCALDTCADVPPPNPDVRCCLGEGECEDRTASECAAEGGVNMGVGVCAPDTCAEVEPTDIQCCVPKQSGDVFECEDRTPEQCAARDGVNMGPGDCDPNPCNP